MRLMLQENITTGNNDDNDNIRRNKDDDNNDRVQHILNLDQDSYYYSISRVNDKSTTRCKKGSNKSRSLMYLHAEHGHFPLEIIIENHELYADHYHYFYCE